MKERSKMPLDKIYECEYLPISQLRSWQKEFKHKNDSYGNKISLNKKTLKLIYRSNEYQKLSNKNSIKELGKFLFSNSMDAPNIIIQEDIDDEKIVFE